MPVILATWEAEIGKTEAWSQSKGGQALVSHFLTPILILFLVGVWVYWGLNSGFPYTRQVQYP
jgi:hypothetical protein